LLVSRLGVKLLAWIGVEKNKVEIGKFKEFIERLSYKPKGELTLSIKTSRGWMDFNVIEVVAFVEGIARIIAKEFNVAGLEAGEHLIMGETSARLWDEAVRVVFPDGKEEVITILTYDGFLDIRIPNDNVKGLNATITIAGKVYELPLTLNDLSEIYSKGKEWIEKIEKAAMAYGINRVISKEAIEALRRGIKPGRKVEVDYEAGYVLIWEEGKLRTIPIPTHILELLTNDKVEDAVKIYENAPENIKKEIEDVVKEETELQRSLGRENLASKYETFLSKIKKSQ